ncbi:hypothetical protein [Rathayibacter sp. SD072]|uniref:hypothetical protein n=1 Tax=Rathayibacter sp. SD072 TaxID=2781731 RepID=UPI001A95FDEA|nr:hypothetical protein [Rathayibacter sp. SD072]MBO0985215.1 hypothetical protein [Rathayibacter sp. SD072]
MTTPQPSFDPALLDSAHESDYRIVAEALCDLTHQADSDADHEDESERFEGRPSGDRAAALRAQGERARAISANVERQLTPTAPPAGPARACLISLVETGDGFGTRPQDRQQART